MPNWNGKEFLLVCLDSLQDQSLTDFQIIVVDNGSTDGSQELIKASYPHVQLVALDKNYGFAGGVNRGIQDAINAGAEYVALFNNDATADKDWLKNLLSTAETNPKAGIVTSKFLKLDKKTIDSTGDFYSIWGLPFPRGRGQTDNGQYDNKNEVFAASGGASLYRVETLKQIGLFDEDFFAYYEDVDISFRAQLAGWKVLFEPKAVAYHHVGGTSSKLGNFARYHSFKNFVFLYTKNMPVWLYWKYLPLATLGFGLMIAHDLTRLRFMPLIKALGKIIVCFPAMLAKRWRVQSSRKVTTKYIDSILYHKMSPMSLTSLRQRLPFLRFLFE